MLVSAGWLGFEPLHAQVANDEVTSPEEALGGLLALGLVLAALSLLHWALLRMKRRGLMRYDDERAGRGLGRAVGALGSILQPHHPAPDEQADRVELRAENHPADPPGEGTGSLVPGGGAWPEDGLRGPGPPPSRPP